ncbi:(-)-germacrene D synthase-like isoform X1 [Ipomoea triloba]|uniref:(-)-germacrene D synthase-like isoform X1 n=1 Tax=Ipomoea triloba TaxID=35885 RepID=UPI00125DDA02|nr:(-)-germacrene D synthase-like isoform X1 [Ipomoea triloba]
MAYNNQLLSVLPSNQTQLDRVTRRSANYHPTIWGDYFLTYSSQPKEVHTQEWLEHQQLKEELKNMLVEVPDTSFKKLDLINKIQRLGVHYQFEKEIEASLEHIFKTYDEFNAGEDQRDLYNVSLCFRLLRQEGYHVSANTFEKFMDCDGKFKESFINNVPALLSLYEASHLRVHGEQVLEEALIFTTSHLESILPNLTNNLRSQVSEALKQPIRKRLIRLDAQKFISTFEPNGTQDALLLKFAKLDFNLLQKEHQRELGSLTRWWKGLDVPNKLSFARDRLVECYFWILGVYFEPKYSVARKFLIKVLSMTSIIDDIYDVYGTLDELKLFNDAVQRWDAGALIELPEYMRTPYIYLLDIYTEMENELSDNGQLYRVNYAKEEMKKAVGAYFEEAKWYLDGCNPTFEEYMKLAMLTSGYQMMATTSLVGMQEDFVTKDLFDWVNNGTLIVQAASIICRLMDDIVGHEFEQQRGHLDSSVEIYMKEYGKSKEETIREFLERITNAWKDINQQCLKPTSFPMPILIRVLNFARVIDLLYSDEDSYTHSKTKLKDCITSILVNPIS